jgi:hypothetical protein
MKPIAPTVAASQGPNGWIPEGVVGVVVVGAVSGGGVALGRQASGSSGAQLGTLPSEVGRVAAVLHVPGVQSVRDHHYPHRHAAGNIQTDNHAHARARAHTAVDEDGDVGTPGDPPHAGSDVDVDKRLKEGDPQIGGEGAVAPRYGVVRKTLYVNLSELTRVAEVD